MTPPELHDWIELVEKMGEELMVRVREEGTIKVPKRPPYHYDINSHDWSSRTIPNELRDSPDPAWIAMARRHG